ncbi:MAG TPA: hypothetical protein VN045_05415 [Microbacteriaceae bacterium]|jgi:hypothetical protein|nr:hypothetical protein [Microbacteriaceae bacterium]
MNWTRTDSTRRRIVIVGLILGPVMLAVSNAFVIQAQGNSMRDVFDAMTANPSMLIVQSLLEGGGFMIAFASFAGAVQATRVRGGALGTWGAALCIVGILGFALSSANGLAFYSLAPLHNHDVGFAAATAVVGDAAISTIQMILTLAGQLGICLVIGGLIRARVCRIWPLLLVVAGIIVNMAFSMILTTLVADLLLLAAGTWIAVALARSPHEIWLGQSPMTTVQRVRAEV